MKNQVTITVDDFLNVCRDSKLKILKSAQKNPHVLSGSEMILNLMFELYNAQLTSMLFKDDDKLEIEGHE